MITTTKNINQELEPKLETIYFLNLDGSEEICSTSIKDRNYVADEDHNKYGKVEVYRVGNRIDQHFFLKQFRGGRPGELLVDPYGMFAKAEDLSSYVNIKGHTFCEYVRVNPEIYHSYVNYLTSRDIRYFRYAEKAVLDTVK